MLRVIDGFLVGEGLLLNRLGHTRRGDLCEAGLQSSILLCVLMRNHAILLHQICTLRPIQEGSVVARAHLFGQ